MKIAICDDEKKLRRDLAHLIGVELDLAGISYTLEEFEDGSALAASSSAKDIDILFLDIEMPLMDGMETARKLRQMGHKMLIIFVTAYPDYVFQGYEVQAFHYLLKPYQERKIKEVLGKALEELEQKDEQYYLVEQKSASLRIKLSQVYYFKSDRRSVFAVTACGQESFYGKLDQVEAEVGDGFQRVHNRYLVNLRFVSRVEANSCVCGGEEIPVSRAYKQQLAVVFAQMMLK